SALSGAFQGRPSPRRPGTPASRGVGVPFVGHRSTKSTCSAVAGQWEKQTENRKSSNREHPCAGAPARRPCRRQARPHALHEDTRIETRPSLASLSEADDLMEPATLSATTSLDVEGKDGVVRLTLNRPEKRNALSRELLSQMETTLGAIAADASARV